MNKKLNTFLKNKEGGKGLISDIYTKEIYRILGDDFKSDNLGFLYDISNETKLDIFNIISDLDLGSEDLILIPHNSDVFPYKKIFPNDISEEDFIEQVKRKKLLKWVIEYDGKYDCI